MIVKYCVGACAWAMFVSAACAHGPQVQVTATGGKIVTRSLIADDYEVLTSPKSLYVMEVLEYRGSWYPRPETQLNPPEHPTAPGQPVSYSGPGLAYGRGETFAAGSSLSLAFTTGLQQWNGAGFSDAGSTELQYYRGGSIGAWGQLVNPAVSIVTHDGEASPELSFAAIAAGYDASAHASARLRFLGDGSMTPEGSGPQIGTVASEPPDGVYLATLVLASSDASLAASDPFYFVMHKGVGWSEVTAAVRALNVPSSMVQVLGVPEPSTLAIVGLALCGATVRRRFPA